VLAANEISEVGGINGVPITLMGLDWSTEDAFKGDEIIRWANQF
jgi:hypothetical protein